VVGHPPRAGGGQATPEKTPRVVAPPPERLRGPLWGVLGVVRPPPTLLGVAQATPDWLQPPSTGILGVAVATPGDHSGDCCCHPQLLVGWSAIHRFFFFLKKKKFWFSFIFYFKKNEVFLVILIGFQLKYMSSY